MDKTRKILLLECLGAVALVILLACIFETGVATEGTWATDNGALLFLIQSLMTILLFLTIPCALYLFRAVKVRQALATTQEKALLRWGSVRILLLCVPMVADMAFYYLFGAVVGFFYMAVIYLLSLTFVFPTKRRFAHDCQPVEAPQADESTTEVQ